MSRSHDPARAALWSERIARLERSGLTVAQFCKEESLNVCSLYQWKKKLSHPQDPSPQQSPRFVAVQVLPTTQALPAILRLPAGLSIELPASFPADAVTGIVAACIDAVASASSVHQSQ
jgi:hypothetical protein